MGYLSRASLAAHAWATARRTRPNAAESTGRRMPTPNCAEFAAPWRPQRPVSLRGRSGGAQAPSDRKPRLVGTPRGWWGHHAAAKPGAITPHNISPGTGHRRRPWRPWAFRNGNPRLGMCPSAAKRTTATRGAAIHLRATRRPAAVRPKRWQATLAGLQHQTQQLVQGGEANRQRLSLQLAYWPGGRPRGVLQNGVNSSCNLAQWVTKPTSRRRSQSDRSCAEFRRAPASLMACAHICAARRPRWLRHTPGHRRRKSRGLSANTAGGWRKAVRPRPLPADRAVAEVVARLAKAPPKRTNLHKAIARALGSAAKRGGGATRCGLAPAPA